MEDMEQGGVVNPTGLDVLDIRVFRSRRWENPVCKYPDSESQSLQVSLD